MSAAPTSVRPELVEGLHLGSGSEKKASPSTGSGRTALFALALAFSWPAFADSNLPPAYWSDRQLPDPKQEAQAQALMNEVRCLVCQGQSIADSNAELAGDMRDLVRRRIAAGQKPAEIRAWLVQRYGSWISYKPTAEPAAWPLWLAPLGLLLVGAFLLRGRIRLTGRP